MSLRQRHKDNLPKNTLKGQEPESSPEPAKAKAPKAKVRETKDDDGSPSRGGKKWLDWIRDERTRRVAGLTLILFSLFLGASFISYFFHWKFDQSTAYSGFDAANPPKNALGYWGALASHVFIHNWFGVASFLVLPVIFFWGVKWLYQKTLARLNRAMLIFGFFAIWSSGVLGYLVPQFEGGILAGQFGVKLSIMLGNMAGPVGTLLIYVFTVLVFSIIVFNASLRWPQKSTATAVNDDVSLNSETEEADQPLNVYTHRNEIATADGESPLPWEEEEEDIPIDEIPDFEVKDLDENEVVAEDNAPLEDEIETDTEALATTAVEPETPFEALEIVPEEPEAEPEHATLEFEMPDVPPVVAPPVSAIPDLEFSIEAPQTPNSTAETPATPINAVEEFSENRAKADQLAQDLVQKYGEFDPKLDLPHYKFPSLEFLVDFGDSEIKINKEELEENKNKIVETLRNYNIDIAKIKATVGPTVTLYEIVPAAGVRISKIKNLEDDIALSLAALGIRIIAPIPGKGTIGIEVPNQNPEIVPMRNLLLHEKFTHTKFDLPVALGKTISNEVFIADLSKMPHLLMAGATGQGKSVGLNAILVSLLYKKHPAEIKFVMVDPKKVELTLYNLIEKHFLAKLPGEEEAIITDTKKVISTLNSLCIEMDNRYELLKNAQVRNLKEYNAKFVGRRLNPTDGHRFLPYIVLVIDEFADLIMTAGKEVEMPIARLAQLARAIGIHLIIATQRPSVNIITGTIKANFPARIAFRVTSKIDSRTILDAGGAEQLIGRGDMLFSTGNDLIRLQCPFVDTPEVEKIAHFIGGQPGYPEALKLPEYVGEEGDPDKTKFDSTDKDPLFEDAARIIVQHQQGSASLLQRRLNLGYNRAGRLIDQMEAAGIVGPNQGSKARQVLIHDEMALEQFLKNLL